jgi:hypothetical protein
LHHVVDQRDASVVFNAIVATFGHPATVDLPMLAYDLVVGSADLMVVMIDHPLCFTVSERTLTAADDPIDDSADDQ